MAEEILSKDEAKKIAIDYVRQKEGLGDVTIEGEKLSTLGGLLLYEFEGKAKRHVMIEGHFDAVIAERPFKLQILVKDRTVFYSPSAWVKKSFEQIPRESFPTLIYADPVIDQTTRPETLADALLKFAKAEDKRAEAKLKEELAKEIRNKGGNDLSSLARKYGIDQSRL